MRRQKKQRDYNGKQWPREFYSKRPMKWFISNAEHKRMCNRIERAQLKATLYKEVQDA